MSDPYTIVLWCADAARFVSMVGAHLLTEGILAANAGRIDDEVPVAVGVANARRWPVFSRTVAARGVIFARSPQVTTRERHDFLLTFADVSGRDASGLDASRLDATLLDTTRAPSANLRVIRAADLVEALEAAPAPSTMSKAEALALFSSVARERAVDGAREERSVTDTQTATQTVADTDGEADVHEIADCCQRLVRALAG